MLLAEGWNSPRATVVMHLAPTASRRVYQQRIGRIMRMHPRKEAGIVVDFVNKGSTHNERVDHPALAARRGLLPRGRPRHSGAAPPLPAARPPQADAGAVARPRHSRRATAPRRHRARVAADRPEVPRRRGAALLGDDRRARRAFRGARRDRQELHGRARRQGGARPVPLHLRRREPQPAAADDGARRPRFHAQSTARDFDDLVTLVTQAPTWRRTACRGPACCCSAIAQEKADAPEQILARWTWRLARATRKAQDRAASAEFPRRSACSARSPTRAATATRRTPRSSSTAALEQPLPGRRGVARLGRGLHAARDKLLDAAREKLGTVQEVAGALAENLPEPKPPRRSRRRRRRKKRGTGATPTPNGSEAAPAAEAEAVQPAEATSPAEAS